MNSEKSIVKAKDRTSKQPAIAHYMTMQAHNKFPKKLRPFTFVTTEDFINYEIFSFPLHLATIDLTFTSLLAQLIRENPELLVKWLKPQVYTIKTAHHGGTTITGKKQLSWMTFMDGYHGMNCLKFVIDIPTKLGRREASKNLRLKKVVLLIPIQIIGIRLLAMTHLLF